MYWTLFIYEPVARLYVQKYMKMFIKKGTSENWNVRVAEWVGGERENYVLWN